MLIPAEAAASGATREPMVELVDSFPAVVNDGPASARTLDAFTTWLGEGRVVDPGVVTGSEDVGLLATAAGVLCVY